MTGRQQQRLTLVGFVLCYLAAITTLVCATSPHFDGYRSTVVSALAVVAIVGALSISIGRFSKPAP